MTLNNENIQANTSVNKGITVINDAIEQLADQASEAAYQITVDTGIEAIQQIYRYRVAQAVQKAVDEVVDLAVDEGNQIVSQFEENATSKIITLEKQLQIPTIEAKTLSRLGLRKSNLKDRLNAARANEKELKFIENATPSDVENWIEG